MLRLRSTVDAQQKEIASLQTELAKWIARFDRLLIVLANQPISKPGSMELPG